MKPRIVIINGASSVGKTSTAKAIQSIVSVPYMHVQMDMFLEMQPAWLDNHTEGLQFQNIGTEDQPEIALSSGPIVQKLMAGMRSAIAAMLEQGNNLIVDDVLWEQSAIEHYQHLLQGYNPKFVLLDAPLDVVEKRERLRGDRIRGLARWQLERIRQMNSYNLVVDTSKMSCEICAKTIVDRFRL